MAKSSKKVTIIKSQALQKTIASAIDGISNACKAGVAAITVRTTDSKKLLATSKGLAKKCATLTKRAKAAALKAKKNPGADSRKALSVVEKDLAKVSKELKTCNADKAANSGELSELKLNVKHLKAYLKSITDINKALKPVEKKTKAKKKPAEKTTTAKKATSKKAVTKKTVAKTTTAKKAIATKTVATKTVAKKTVAKKTTAKPDQAAIKVTAKPKVKTKPKAQASTTQKSVPTPITPATPIFNLEPSEPPILEKVIDSIDLERHDPMRFANDEDTDLSVNDIMP